MKFPFSWADRMGSSSYDKNGNLTAQAQSWATELSGITPEMVKIGLRDLSHLPNPDFPPSAMKFVKHCRERYKFPVVSEILERIRNSKKSWNWSGLVAWNVFYNLHYNSMGNETQDQLRSRIEKVYDSLSWHDLKPIPDNSVKALPERDYHPINDEKGYQQYTARVHALLRANSDTLESHNTKVEKVFPKHVNDDCLLREWWPEFRDSGMEVGEFLRDKGLNLPKEPNRDDPMSQIFGLAEMVAG